jgi:chloramphenicol 3-O phosphotransferase
MIIFLNGCSSTGKTSVAKRLQNLFPKPLLLVGVDSFIQMMPEQYTAFGEKASEGFVFIPGENAQGPTIEIKSGLFGKSFFSSCTKLVGLLANEGHDLIVDEVLLDNASLKGYVETLVNHIVYYIQVTCDLTVMQEREISRQDRFVGLANHQFTHIHEPTYYDLRIDTTNTPPLDCAKKILAHIEENKNPDAFKQLYAKYISEK